MKRLILILVCWGIPFSLFAQQWQWLYPYPTTNTVIDFYFTDKDNGFIIAENGEILRTNDGGSTWESKTIAGIALIDIFCLSNTCWILGMESIDWNNNYIILKTDDGGVNWEKHNIGLTWGNSYNCLYFISEAKGWIAGAYGGIQMTNDGGATWSDKSIISNDSPHIFFIHFTDDQNGTVIGQNSGIVIGKTSDGGSSWSLKSAGVGNNFYYGCYSGPNTYYTAGERGLILKTNNYGGIWSFPSNIPLKTLNSISFCDQMTGWVVGGDSTVMKTNDGGETWEAQSLGLSSEFMKVKFKDSNTGWILGTQDEYDYQSSQSFLVTYNRGENWENKFISFDEIMDFQDVCFVDSLRGWIISDAKIYRTNNGGKTWKLQYANPDDGWGSYEYLNSIFFVDSLKGFCVGSKSDNGLILKTLNGGVNWTSQSYAFGPLTDVHFISALTGWFVGNGGIILRTLNGGASFEYLSSGVVEGIVDVYFLDEDHGWALTESQTILKTNDGGISWTPYDFSTSYDYGKCVFFADTLTGFVGTSNGLYKSTNGGKNWGSISLTSYANITDIYFANAQEGWVLAGYSDWWTGPGGVVYYTQDGGAMWNEVFNSGKNFAAFSFVPEGYAWIVGNNSTIAKYTHGKHLTEVNFKKSEIGPTSYQLYQCYPNPFNPSTTITFDLPEKSFVELKIYDALGQEVKTLVNGYKDKGRHQVSLNLQNYASGTYFYRIKANDFSKAKKLLLVK